MRKAIRRIMAVMVAFSLVFTGVYVLPAEVQAKTVSVKGTYHQTDARKMLKKINKFRTGDDAWYYTSEGSDDKTVLKDLSKFKYDYTLEKIAMKRAAEIAVSFSHTRPNGSDCFSCYPDGYMWKGENIAYGQDSVNSVMNDWKETNEPYSGQGHRRNMLSENFTCIGIACFEYNGMKYWVQEFGSPTINTEKTKACDKTKTVKVKS